MPIVRDGNNRVTEYDMGLPPGSPSGPVERVSVPGEVLRTPGIQATGLPRYDSKRAVDRPPATLAESRQRGTAAMLAKRKAPTPSEDRAAAEMEAWQAEQAAEGSAAAAETTMEARPRFPLGRDRAARQAAVLGALRATSTVRDAAAQLGVTETRVGQILREIRLAGMPADLDAAIKSRSAIAAATRTGKVPLAPAGIDRAGPSPAAEEVATPPGPTVDIAPDLPTREGPAEDDGRPYLTVTIDCVALARAMQGWATYEMSAFFDGLAKVVAEVNR